MIDLEREREEFIAMSKANKCNMDNEELVEDNFKTWCKRAELAQQEIASTQRELEFATSTINNLLDKLEAKHKAYIFLDDCRKEWHNSFISKCEENKELKPNLLNTKTMRLLLCRECRAMQ